MGRLPTWAVEIKTIMAEYRITNRQTATAIGKSEQWVSNVLTGYKKNEQTQKDICDYIYGIKNTQKASECGESIHL